MGGTLDQPHAAVRGEPTRAGRPVRSPGASRL